MNDGALPGVAILIACAAGLAIGCGSSHPTTTLSRDELLDPTTCDNCHADHYRDWAVSMHAYAGDDPVFVAMNARGQRETKGALGTFCVNCHAPMAVRDGKTSDGLNLATLEAKYRGVTCFFCHSVDSVLGDHDDQLQLATDLVMRGPFSDPVANTGHVSGYSSLHDRNYVQSAQLCGSCHDVVNGNGVAIERTYDEWKNQTVYSESPGGDTCGQCHMSQSPTEMPIAQAPGAKNRYFHGHAFPGVDVAVTPFGPPGASGTQQVSNQTLLDTTLQTTLCVGDGTTGMLVILDNVAAGHGWPSGSAQDRRAWIEVIAYSGQTVVYQSGVVPAGTPVTSIADPDLWLLRDCMLDDQNKPVDMFWQAQKPSESYQLPGQMTYLTTDQRFYETHIYQTFPQQTALSTPPDRVTLRVRVQAIGLDVIDDLTGTGDLTDTMVRAKIPTYDVGSNPLVEWTPAKGVYGYSPMPGVNYTCVTNTGGSFVPQVPATPHVYCKP
jgi:Cytochrome c554 and c-prime